MQNAYIVTGTVAGDGTLRLDETLPIKAGKVRVTVEVIDTPPILPYTEFMTRLRRQQAQRGHVPPTREEVDAYLNAERDSWDK